MYFFQPTAKVHNIKRSSLADKPPFSETWGILCDFLATHTIGKEVIMTYYSGAKYDFYKIMHNIRRHELDLPANLTGLWDPLVSIRNSKRCRFHPQKFSVTHPDCTSALSLGNLVMEITGACLAGAHDALC